MKKFFRKVYILCIVLFMFNVFYVKNSFASSTTTYDKSNVLSLEKQAEYDKKVNRDLDTLEVDGFDLNPVFNKNTVDYYITIPVSKTSLEVKAIPVSSLSKVKITGNESLFKNDNDIIVSVKSEKGLSKDYKIHVTKQKESKIKLKLLNIDGQKLNPEFNSDKFVYNIDANMNEVKPFKIKAVANSDSAKVEIIGNDDSLAVGNNVITILVTGDSEVVTYQINAKISTEHEITIGRANDVISQVKNNFKNSGDLLPILIGIIVVLFVVIFVLIRKILKRKKDDDKK